MEDARTGEESTPRTKPKRRRWWRWLLALLLLPFALLLLVGVALYIPAVQDIARGKVVGFLGGKIGTTVALEHLALRFPLGLSIEGLYIEDQQGDTLLYAGALKARVSATGLFDQRIAVTGLSLSDTRAHLAQDTDSVFNFQFIVDAFNTDTTSVKVDDGSPGWAFEVDGVALNTIHFSTDLKPSQLALDLHLGALVIDMETFDLDSMRFHARTVEIGGTHIAMRTAPSVPQPDTYPHLEPPFAGLDIRVGNIVLNNSSFSMASMGTHDSLWLAVEKIDLGVNEMDLSQQKFHLSNLTVEALGFGMLSTDTTTVEAIRQDPPWLDQNDGFRYFLRDFDIAADNVSITRSAFAMHQGSMRSATSDLDTKHIVVEDLEAQFVDLRVNNDTLAANTLQLRGAQGPNKDTISVSMDLLATSEALIVDSANLGWSGLQARFALRAEQGSLSNAYRNPEQVPVSVRLATAIDRAQWPKIIALLPPGTLPVTTIAEGFVIDAHIAGIVDRLDTVNIQLDGDAGSSLHAHGHIAHAMDPKRAVYDFSIDPFVMGVGVKTIADAYVPKDSPFPQRLKMITQISGAPHRIDAQLDVQSDLGNVRGPVSIQGLKGSIPDAFNLDLQADQVALARLIGDTAWKAVDVHISGEGTALNSTARKAWVTVEPSHLEHSGTDLSDLRLRADVEGDSIQAVVKITSEPLTLDLTANGTWPEKNDSIAADVTMHVVRADLRALGLVEHELAVIGDWNGRLAFDSTAHGSISLGMDGTQLESGSSRFVFEALQAHTYLGSDSTSAHVESDALDLHFDANIGMDTLLVRAVDKGRSFFTRDTVYRADKNERLDLVLDLKRTEWLTDMVLPQLHAIDLELLEAHYDGAEDALSAKLILPHLRYDSMDVRAVDLSIDAQGAGLTATFNAERVAQGKYAVEGIAVEASGSGGALRSQLRIMQEETERYRLGARMDIDGDDRIIHMDTALVLDSRPWTVDGANSVRIGADRFVADRFELRSGDEALIIRTPGNTLDIVLEQFRIPTIANIITNKDSFPIADGRIDGMVKLPLVDEQGLNADLTIHDLALLNTALGTLDVDLTDQGKERYHGVAKLSHTSNQLDATADIAPEQLQANAELDLNDIGFLEPFVSNYIYELGGGLDGKLAYRQQGDRSTAEGRLHFKQARVGVVMTGATYTLADEVLVMQAGGLHFDDFDLLDTLGNVFRVDGDIRTTDLADPKLDLRVRTERFQLVNSTIEQNPLFFGDLFAGIDLRALGPATRPKVTGDVNILPGTVFSVVLPGSTVELVNGEGVVVFTDDLYAQDSIATTNDAEALRDSLAAHLPGVELDVKIHVDKEGEFAIVLDPAAGDQATVSGSADLIFRYAPDAPMYLNGTFVVERGAYTLDLYGLVKKRFELVKGGTVRWSGDPVKAEMGLQARYLSETAPYALVATGTTMVDSERNRLQQPLPFSVLINIDGSMVSPDISFNLDLDRQLRNSFPKVGNRLDQLNQQGNAEDLNRQVFGLLVLNSFIQDEGSGGSPSSGIATSAARNSVNGLLTDQMNKLTGKYLKGVDISLGVNTYDQVTGQNSYQRTSLDYRVSKRVLNDRLSFEVGGSVGVDEQNSQVSNVSNTRAAQYAILYDLTADGRFRIRGFHENSYDLYDGEITNSGVAFMFTQDFEENERARATGRKAAEEKQELELKERKTREEAEEKVKELKP